MADLSKKRNVVLAGHGGAGKTTLAEALLFKAGVTSRWGKVEDGTSHLDYEDDEKERKSTVHASVASFDHGGVQVSLIDTPGYPDFVGEVYSCMPAVETVCIVINANDGVGVNTRRAWQLAEVDGKARAIVVTHCDTENVPFDEVMSKIRSSFGDRCIPLDVPVGWGATLSGVASVLDVANAPDEVKEVAGHYRKEAVEAAVEADDALMEKYLEEGDMDDDSVHKIIPKAMLQRTFTPVFYTSTTKDVGFQKLLTVLEEYFPSPLKAPVPTATRQGDAVEVKPDGPFAAQVFKVQHGAVGKQAFLRVWAGSMDSGSSVTNAQTGKTMKIGDFVRPVGKDTTALKTASAGDIVMLGKVDLTFGDTITASDEVEFERVRYPRPMVVRAITPKSRNDETKMGEALAKLCEGDPTFVAEHDPDTKELVARGISELHLELKLKQLKDRYKVEVETAMPRIPYRETITAAVESHHRHKKQTGGAGQFGEVYIKVEPAERGTGFEFLDEVVGGVIPNVYIPAVEKGIREKMDQGIVAGYPVVDLRVRLYDGKYHPVDSKEIAFKTAGREAIKKAVREAKPKLLEPIVDLTVEIPAKYMGDITGDLNGRRGRVVGMDTHGDMQVIKAQIPLGEVQTYPAVLRSMTGGEGSYAIDFSHYDIVPGDVAETIIAKYEDKDEE
jgi:elongation factor G